MSDLLKVAIPALSALFGVIVGLAIGFYQWKVERREVRISEYLRKRRESYQIFFDKLEDAHLELRLSDIDEEDFTLFIIDVNSHLLKNAIYMDQEDRELADRYLRKLLELKGYIEEGSDEIKKKKWHLTTIGTPYNPLEEEVEYIRRKIIDKVRHVLKT